MRVVLDSSVFISALIVSRGHAYAAVNAAFDRRFELMSSDHILSEIDRNVRLPRLMKRVSLDAAQTTAHLDRIRALATIVEPSPSTSGAVRDPDDDLILGTALAGEANYLVTGDADLLTIGSYAGIEIITPARFLEILEEQQAP